MSPKKNLSKKPLNVLLIWEALPDEIKYYHFVNPPVDVLRLISKANGEIGNLSEKCDNAVYLSDYLYENRKTLKQIDHLKPNFTETKFDLIFVSGFYS